MIKESESYKDLGSNVGQGTLRMLDKAWKSFFKAIKDWSKNSSKYLGRPKLPKYKPKDGRFVLSLDSNKIKLKDGYIYILHGSHLSNSIISSGQTPRIEYYNVDLFLKVAIM